MEMSEALVVAARVFAGGAFLLIGLRNQHNHAAIAELIAAKKLPFAKLGSSVGIGMQIVFGGLLVTGYLPLVAALGLLVFTVLATLLAHDFWAKQGEARKADESAFLVNMIIAGGLLAIAAAAA